MIKGPYEKKREEKRERNFHLEQWFPAVGSQRFLDYNSQKSWPAQLMVKAFKSGDSKTGNYCSTTFFSC